MSKTRVRALKIIIDTPHSDSEPWIVMPVQKVVEDDDGNFVQVVDRIGQVHKRLSTCYTDMIQAVDPVTQQPINVSVAGLGALVTVAAAKFLAEQYNGTIDENALVWIGE